MAVQSRQRQQKNLADKLFPERPEREPVEILDVPPEKRRLQTETYDFTVATISEFLREKRIRIPEFQRNYVWKRAQASRLIESLIIQCPIPVIYLDQNSDNTLSVIDGNQRLLSIKLFLENEFKLKGLTAYPELDGLRYSDLDPRFKNHILNRTIRCITILKETHPQIKFDVFERLNTGAVQLTAQELRHGIYFGPLIEKVDELARDEQWLNLLGMRDDKRMKGSELALRFLALRFEGQGYSKPLTAFLNNFAAKHRNASTEILDRWSQAFTATVAKVDRLFGKNAFRIFGDNLHPQPNINSALFDAEMIAVSTVNPPIEDWTTAQRNNFLRAFHGLLQDAEFKRAISASTSDEPNVTGRIRACERFLRGYFDV